MELWRIKKGLYCLCPGMQLLLSALPGGISAAAEKQWRQAHALVTAAMRLTTFLSSKLDGAKLGAPALHHSFGKKSPRKGSAHADLSPSLADCVIWTEV